MHDEGLGHVRLSNYRTCIVSFSGYAPTMTSCELPSTDVLHLQQLCTHTFEGAVMAQILKRWFMYKPKRNAGLTENLRLMMEAICTAAVRFEITPTYIQIFDTEYLRMSPQLMRDFPHLVKLYQPIFPYFARVGIDPAQREITLSGFRFDQMLETQIARESILRSFINKAYRDASEANAVPMIRDVLIGILSELYHSVPAPRKPLVARTIQAMRPNAEAYLNTVPCDVRELHFDFVPYLQPNCILKNSLFCPSHTTEPHVLKAALRRLAGAGEYSCAEPGGPWQESNLRNARAAQGAAHPRLQPLRAPSPPVPGGYQPP